MKEILARLSVILFLSILLVLFPQKIHAKTETSGDLQVIYDDPLFPSSIIWYPGLSITKSFTVKNLSSSSQNISIQATNTVQTGNIADVFLFKVTEANVDRYGGADDKSLKNFWDEGQISLSNLNEKEETNYDITITMLTSAGNEYQGKQAKFDLIIGFVGTPTQVTITGAGDGATGAVGGAAATTCSDTPPSNAPILTSAFVGVNSITLTWTPAGDPVSYYLIAYGTTSGTYSYGIPNVGGKGTTSYTITGLSGGTTYYFVVRAGNGCAPGLFSNELSATAIGGFLAGLPPGFTPGVLGIATPEAKLTPSPESKNNGQIKGEKTASFCKTCLWQPILFGEFIVLLLYFFLIVKKFYQKIKKPLLISLIIPIASYLIFLWLNKDCLTNLIFIKTPSFFCRYFLILDLLIYTLLIKLSTRRVK